MDHIGARVYIGRSPNSSFLSLVIKFGTASADKQAAHLESIARHSLCTSACPSREQIDVREILSATGINVSLASEVDPDMTNQDLQNETYHIIQRPTSQLPEDPCEGTYGYYRLACLYDVRIKGLVAADNAVRFAQSFDHIDAIRRSSFTPPPFSAHYQSDQQEDWQDGDPEGEVNSFPGMFSSATSQKLRELHHALSPVSIILILSFATLTSLLFSRS